MDWNKVPYFIVLLNVLGICQGYFETCDQTINIAAGATQTLLSPGYENGYGFPLSSSCRYTIVAPTDYQVRASCSLYLYDTSCTNQRFYFAPDGKQDLSTSTYYCSTATVAQTSVGNRMVLAYINSSPTLSGYFNCTLSTVCDCGWSISSRIVGGTSASMGEFTPMAALVSKSAKVYCGATIVSSLYVLTAAHCLFITLQNNTYISLGDLDTSTGSDSTYAAVYVVANFIPHPQYSDATKLNDIGLVKSATTFVLSRAVAPVCLPFFYTSADFSGTIVTATGWGSLEYGGPSSNVLQKVNLNVQSNSYSTCTAAYPAIASSQLCTYTPNKDTCQYDSGGPLFYRGSTDPRLFLVALVSLGEGCATSKPALNTRVTSFLPWIESVIGAGKLCRRSIS